MCHSVNGVLFLCIYTSISFLGRMVTVVSDFHITHLRKYKK